MTQELTPDHIMDRCVQCRFLYFLATGEFACGNSNTGCQLNLGALAAINRANQPRIFDESCDGREGIVPLIKVINEICAQTRNRANAAIGFSTSCLRQANLGLIDQLKIFLKTGAIFLELNFPWPGDLIDFDLTDQRLFSKLQKFVGITVHAPYVDVKYFDGSGSTNRLIFKLKELAKRIPVSGFVFHSNIVENFNGLEVIDLPILIENTNFGAFGSTAEDIVKIKTDYNFSFVLNLRRIFKPGSPTALFNDLVSAIGNRLSHLQVSGRNQRLKCAPLHLSDNQEAIATVIKSIGCVPIILEGDLEPDYLKMAQAEMEFVSDLK